MKDPAFLFYSNDFLSGTMLMSNEEVGIYIKLLCIQHQQGHLKEKDMLNMGANEKIFSKFRKDNEGNYYNERLETEANKRKKYTESRRNNLKKAHMDNHMEQHMDEHMENENININKTLNQDNRKRGSKGKKEEEKIHFAEFVTMTNAEYDKLVSTYGQKFADQCIKKLDDYKGSSGRTYKSDYRAIGSWVVDEIKKKQSNSSKGGINDFKELMEEAVNDQTGNDTSNNFIGW